MSIIPLLQTNKQKQKNKFLCALPESSISLQIFAESAKSLIRTAPIIISSFIARQIIGKLTCLRGRFRLIFYRAFEGNTRFSTSAFLPSRASDVKNFSIFP